MKRVVRFAAGLLAAALAGGCGLSLFEDVGTDPHPPEMTLLALAYQPGEDADGNTLPPALLPPSGGITVRPNDEGGNKILLRVSYRDAGADIVNFTVRDRDGSLLASLSPTAPKVDLDGDGKPDDVGTPSFFLGVSGEADLESIGISAAQEGAHRIDVWAEDSHESRSAKATFILTIQL